MSTPCTPTPWRGSEHESEHRIESMTSLESPLRHTVESDTEGEIMSHRDSRGESFLLKRASAPKILLEVLSPGGTRLLFLVMYASCALAIWRYNSARTAAEARHEARASVAVEPLGDGVPASVGSRAVWHARLSSLGALFGTTALTVQYPNATVNATTDDDAALRHLVSYAVTVEASRDGYERASGRWSSVLERRRETCEVAYASPGDGVAVLPTAHASWYQNMEAAPSRSGVRSLQVWVDFCLPVDAAAYDGACHVVQPEVAKLLAAGGQFRATYSDVDSLDTSGEAIARVALLGIWAVIAAAWLPYGLGQIRARRRDAAAGDGAAPRLVLLLFGLLLFVDPVDCIVEMLPERTFVPPAVAFGSCASRRFGETCLLAAFLLAADGDGAAASRVRAARQGRPPRRRHLLRRNWFLVAPAAYCGFSLSALAMRFPTLWGVDRAPTLALASWPVDALRAFVACSLGIVLAMFLWGALFAFLLARAGDRLNRTPYVLSRRHQLSYRYFMLQATLVAGIGVASYYHLGVELFHGYRRNLLVLAKGQRHNEVQFTSALQDLAGALEALVADDVRDLASAFCFTVYVALILYLHLPPPAEAVLEDLGELGNLSGVLVGARFAVDERADRKRRRQIRKRTGRAAEPVFVVETASWLAKVSVESYYDVAPKGDADAGDGGAPSRELVGAEDDTYCLVARHATRPYVVVAFRGSASLKHWYVNLDVQRRVDLRDLSPEAAAAVPPPGRFTPRFTPRARRRRSATPAPRPTPRRGGDLDDDDDEAGASREAKGPMDWFLRSAAVLFGGVERGVVAAERGRGLGARRRRRRDPELETFVHPCVHNGFWRAYAGVRPRLLAAVAKALDGEPLCRVLCCGHSLGGALAQVAAADLATHCLPQRRKQTRLSCYTFGSPRVGNHIWARTFDALVPDAYRVVADGDVVPAVPRCCFRHGGTPVVVDPKARAAGFLIVDPSFIEQSLALSYSRKLAPHKLAGYVRGLWGAAGAYGDAPPDALLDAPDAPDDVVQHRAPCRCWRRRAEPPPPPDGPDPTPLLHSDRSADMV
ncbi:phospholipase [Aureococcus anophagefferens]|nr:phospholipase [Aureococcus anophagefferens]